MNDNQVIVKGIVIKHIPVGETDLAVTLLTLERGKISAFAKGAKKPNGKLTGNVEPFCFGTFKLYEGRTSYNIMETDIDNYFESFRQDLEGACYGTFFLELADYYSRENNDEKQLLALLYQSLRALENKSFDRKLVRCIYEIKALVINGEYPGVPNNRDWNESTLYALDFIVNTPVNKLYTFKVSGQVLEEMILITSIYRKSFIDKKLNSLEMLSTFEM
ncbi:MAG: DNA repair protein RecO [Butyrivibrio sp.]|nr:DNA repair protein RecO [Butyrivibrio sp.]